MTFSELEDNWKTYISLNFAEGCIRLKPHTKVNIKSLIQWVRDRIPLDDYPRNFPFPVTDRNDLIERYNKTKQWIDNAPHIANNYTPNKI